MATERTAMTPFGVVVFLDENKDSMLPDGVVVSEQNIAAAGITIFRRRIEARKAA